jgi:hypothetical protein
MGRPGRPGAGCATAAGPPDARGSSRAGPLVDRPDGERQKDLLKARSNRRNRDHTRAAGSEHAGQVRLDLAGIGRGELDLAGSELFERGRPRNGGKRRQGRLL